MSKQPSLRPHAIVTGLIAAGSVATIALHSQGQIDQAKQSAAVTAVIAGVALVFSRNQ
jgi:hypothetical protein